MARTTFRISMLMCIGSLISMGMLCGCDGIWISPSIFVDVSSPEEKPDMLKTPAVIQSTLALEKSIFYQNKSLGIITDLKEKVDIPGVDSTWIVVSDTGAQILNKDLTITHSVPLKESGSRIEFVTVGKENTPGFLNPGQWGVAPNLVAMNGNKTWGIDAGETAANATAVGDLDKDGNTEFVVGFNGSGGVGLYDAHGGRLWNKPDGNVWQVAMVDYDGQGSGAILHSNAAGMMTLRDSQGKIRSQVAIEPYFSDFSLCTWPGQGNKSHVLFTEEGVHWIYDCLGNEVAKLPAKGIDGWGQSYGTSVTFRKNDAAYFAVLADYSLWNVSVLWIYDNANYLVYQEVMEGRGMAILASPDESTGGDRLLVGGQSRVWSYILPQGEANKRGDNKEVVEE